MITRKINKNKISFSNNDLMQKIYFHQKLLKKKKFNLLKRKLTN